VTIDDAFPELVGELGQDAMVDALGVELNQSLSELLLRARDDAFYSLAEVLIARSPGMPLSALLPGLTLRGDEPIPLETLDTRAGNLMRNHSIVTWHALASRSPDDLSCVPRLGRASLSHIVATAIRRAGAMIVAGGEPRHPTSQSTPPPEPEPPALKAPALSGLSLLARWAQSVARALSLGEALDLSGQDSLPQDVAAAVAHLRAISLEEFVGMPRDDAFAAVFENVVARLGEERHVDVIRQRLALEHATLQEVGDQLHVSRARIGQLQTAVEKKLSVAAADPDLAELAWRASELRRRLGIAIRLENPEAKAAIAAQIAGLPSHRVELGVTILLWLAGPYRLDRATGWIHAASGTGAGPPSDVAFFAPAVDEDDRVDMEALRQQLTEVGFVGAAVEDWLQQETKIRELAGSAVLWHGTVADKSRIVLNTLGRPATADELNEIIDEGHSTRGVRGRLLGDDRFVRTDRIHIGLRAWGLEEYSGIVDEITEELERRGGEADVTDLIATVAQRFDLRPSSVEAYTSVPRFVVKDGRIRLRTPSEPYVPRQTVVDETACYVIDDSHCVMRTRVDADVLRGSGRSLAQGLGAWLGVLPGARRIFHFADGDTVLVSWPDSALMGPSIGSLRRAVTAAGGVDGDEAMLVFDRTSDTVEVKIVTTEALEGASGWIRLRLATGIEADTPDELEERLAVAVGATSRPQLRSRLRARGEGDLCQLLEPTSDPELETALNRLRTVL
jgi:hypothetical protein